MKANKKSKRKLYVYLVAMVVAILIAAVPGAVVAKSVYVAAEHHQSLFDAWNVNPDGTITYQATYGLVYSSDPAGVALDSDSETLFITSEFSPGVEIVDPVTLTYLGVSTGPSDLAGIDVDDENDIVYSVQRMTDNLYIFQWDPVAATLTEIAQIDLPGCNQAMGIALDEYRNTLWVADTGAGIVRAYDVDTWTEDMARSFTPSHKPVDVAVDRVRNLIYTVSITGGASVPPGTGSNLLSKWDVAAATETTVDMGYGGVGVAVDEITGYVYVTGYGADNLTVWDTSTTPFTLIQDTGPIGNPAGIVIGNVAYNPLNLAKNDIIVGEGIYIGMNFTYEITFDSPTFDLTNLKITDDLPVELDFVSATEGGVYDPVTHTVVWELGNISAGDPVPTLYLDVKVNQNAQPGTTIYNYATIDGDQIPPTTIIDQDSADPDDEPGTPVLPSIPVAVDIKPTSCRNPLNVGAKGVLPAAILGTEDFDVTQIDPASVLLGNVAPLRWALEDVATPFEPYIGKQDAFDCTTEGPDGFMDLTFKFDTQEVVADLGDVEDGDVLVLQLTGNLLEEYGGTPIVGEDVVVILKKGK